MEYCNDYHAIVFYDVANHVGKAIDERLSHVLMRYGVN